jgi:hypothetical protein
MLDNELDQGDILSGVCFGLALLAYADILLCSIWAIHRIRQTPVPNFVATHPGEIASAEGYEDTTGAPFRKLKIKAVNAST